MVDLSCFFFIIILKDLFQKDSLEKKEYFSGQLEKNLHKKLYYLNLNFTKRFFLQVIINVFLFKHFFYLGIRIKVTLY